MEDFDEHTMRGNGKGQYDRPDPISGELPDEIFGAYDRARIWVIDNPFAALGIAAAAGFFIGRISRVLR